MKKYLLAAATFLSIALFATAVPAFAQTTGTAFGGATHGQWMGRTGGKMTPPAVFGTVSAINGTTLSVTSKAFGGPRPMQNGTTVAPSTAPAAGTVFTVDATNATVMKNNATSTLSSIAVGDTVVVQGTVSGTNVTATTIRDGVMMRTPGAGMGKGNYASTTSPITGNGEPVVAGKVTSINGTTIAITNASNVSYTVDASNAKIVKGGTTGTATISNIAVGDQVVVQGTISGSSVTATSVIDQVGGGANAPPSGTPAHKGFFGSIGSFFSHLFGF